MSSITSITIPITAPIIAPINAPIIAPIIAPIVPKRPILKRQALNWRDIPVPTKRVSIAPSATAPRLPVPTLSEFLDGYEEELYVDHEC